MSKCLAQEKHKQRAVRIQCRFRHLADLQDFAGAPNRSNTTAPLSWLLISIPNY
jgi:hypothetical protein